MSLRLAALVWYIGAMVFKGLAIFALLLAIAQAPAPAVAQATSPSPTTRHTPAPATAPRPAPQTTAVPAGRTECNGGPCEDQQPRVIVTLPSPTPAPWPVHDRIAWAAYLVLAILGYVGIMLAVSTLKKIERHTSAAEASSAAALETAQAALLNAQAIVNAERPWLLIAVEPSPGVENSFRLTATNRGRSPGTIVGALDQIRIAADEASLPATPEYKTAEPGTPFVPIIMLPGEFTVLRTFSRDDVRGLCASEESFQHIASWEEKLFIYGRVTYKDLIAPPGKELYQTNWCCWYIHGSKKSGLVIAGPPDYNSHT